MVTDRIRLHGISPEAYRHPLDQQATDALRTIPGFELLITKLSRMSLERILYYEYLASAVRVTPTQCGKIHNLLRDACDVLDMPEPTLFISQTPMTNAFALGREFPSIVLWTGIIELLDENELRAVIAHELAHIQCGHSIYRIMAMIVLELAKAGTSRLLPQGMPDLISMRLQVAMMEWVRMAEFSCDRAAILVAQDPEVVFSLLFKLSGGSPKIFEMMDRDAYLAQAEEYERKDTPRIDHWYRWLVETEKSHPLPVLRAREALDWGNSDAYKTIIGGEYTRRGSALNTPPTACPHCGKDTNTSFTFCFHCGCDRNEPIESKDDSIGQDDSIGVETGTI
jgi:Zn-dependent protease with chaperone function